jgi:hypothetical protein
MKTILIPYNDGLTDDEISQINLIIKELRRNNGRVLITIEKIEEIV